jgi:hypothetical protein
MSERAGRSGVRDFEIERAELQAVLESEIFRRAPLLHSFLSYICEKYFRGEAQDIKEYSIAVDALGRPTDFNHTTDSIVRVEAHRLRKRLREYYEANGASHSVQIRIPPGAYVPVFDSNQQVAQPEPSNGQNGANGKVDDKAAYAGAASEGALAISSTVLTVPYLRRSKTGIVVAAAVTALLLLAVYLAASGREARSTAVLGSSAVLAGGFELPGEPSELDAVVRISAGLNQTLVYVDGFGRPWQADRYFEGGTTGEAPGRFIARCNDPMLFRTYREGDFRYDIPLQPGSYEMRLHFAETTFGAGNPKGGAESSRQFNVTCNGKLILSRFDILADAHGPNTADVKIFRDVSPAEDGFLHLEFQSINDKALLSGLEILKTAPGASLPIRIMAGRSSYYHDGKAREWSADQYFDGGENVLRRTVVKGTSDPNLYGGERYGNFTYSLPVAEGSYRLKLLFAETWFGPTNPGGNGPGSRVFDVYCNGVKLLKGFDLFREAGGENIAVERTFRNVLPNAQGKVVLSFVPIHNYAVVNAIELVSETQPQRRSSTRD